MEACREIKEQKGKTYWKTIKKLTKYNFHNTTDPIEINGNPTTNDQDIADAFAEHFKKNFKVNEDPRFDAAHRKQVDDWFSKEFAK